LVTNPLIKAPVPPWNSVSGLFNWTGLDATI
jgi:hypothetical protein